MDFDNLNRLVDEFISLKPNEDKIFYIWGHAYEFDLYDAWDKFEDILKKLSGHEDIFYGTNKEILLNENND